MISPKLTKVCFRILPEEKIQWDYVKILNDSKTIYVRSIQDINRNPQQNAPPKFWSFETDGIFYNKTQSDLYGAIIENVIEQVLHGENCVILGFGQTGSGKSTTIAGLEYSHEDQGILPRAITDVFRLKDNLPRHLKTCMCVSYIEIAKKHTTDLLKPWPGVVGNLKEITRKKVHSENEAFELVFLGEGRKDMATESTYHSHLHTSIFTIHFYAKDLTFETPKLFESKLHVIDLAGVDSVGNFTCLFKNPTDIGTSNLAKSQLEQFFLVLGKNVPYNTKLKQNLNAMLQYLDGSFNTSTILRFIGHIRVNRENLNVTLSMLRFGLIISRSMPKQVEITDSALIAAQSADEADECADPTLDLQLRIQQLNIGLNEERIKHVERTLDEFLNNKISKITLLNVVDPETALEVMKIMCKHGSKTSIANSNQAKMASARPSTTSATRPKSSSKRGSQVTLSSRKSYVKGSTISVSRKTSGTSKRKTGSNASVYDKQKASKSVLMPEILPEFKDAWSSYMTENDAEYHHFLSLYKANEDLVRTIHPIYMNEMQKMKNLANDVDNAKQELILAKLTAELRNDVVITKPEVALAKQSHFFHASSTNDDDETHEVEMCALKNLELLESLHQEQQEKVLELQAELKIYLNRGREIKAETRENFDNYCKDKYSLTIEPSLGEEFGFNVENIVSGQEDQVVVDEEAEMNEIRRFQLLQRLTASTRKQTSNAKSQKKNEWVGLLYKS